MGWEMLKHTPGPWSYIGDDDGDFVVFAGGEFVCNIGESPFAAVSEYPETTIVAFDTDQANARLISAAPDLLEACKGMLENYITLRRISLDLARSDRPGWCPGVTVDDDVHVIAVRAAIAKAEGGE